MTFSSLLISQPVALSFPVSSISTRTNCDVWGVCQWSAFTPTSTLNTFYDHLPHFFLTVSIIYPYAAGCWLWISTSIGYSEPSVLMVLYHLTPVDGALVLCASCCSPEALVCRELLSASCQVRKGNNKSLAEE